MKTLKLAKTIQTLKASLVAFNVISVSVISISIFTLGFAVIRFLGY